MGNLNVAVLGARDFAGKVGKRGTATDVTFYDHREGGDSFTLIEPTKYPEKLSSLFYSAAMSEFAILVVDSIDSFLGETIVMADSMGLSEGWLVLRNYIQPEQLRPLLAGTCLEGYELREEDPIAMRGELIELARSKAREPGEGTRGSCPVDSHFNVKGVGTVVIGSVVDGWFRKHDKMTVLPLNREVVLKSIQKHDVDADFGVKGDHVGLALRGVESDELDRGYVVTTDQSVKASRRVEGRVSLVRYWPSPLREGMVLHLGHWMQMVPCRVASVDDDGDFRSASVTLELESDVIHRPGDVATLMYLEGGKLRVAGSVVLPRPLEGCGAHPAAVGAHAVLPELRAAPRAYALVALHVVVRRPRARVYHAEYHQEDQQPGGQEAHRRHAVDVVRVPRVEPHRVGQARHQYDGDHDAYGGHGPLFHG